MINVRVEVAGNLNAAVHNHIAGYILMIAGLTRLPAIVIIAFNLSA